MLKKSLGSRQIIAVLFVVLSLSALTWFTIESLLKSRSHVVFRSFPTDNPIVTYGITVTAFDPDLQIAQVTATVNTGAIVFAESSVRKRFPGLPEDIDLHPEKVKIMHEPLRLLSLDGLFSRFGLVPLQYSKCSIVNESPPPPLPLLGDKPSSEATEELEELKGEIRAMGNPALYPFDTYLIIGYVRSDTFLMFGEPVTPHFWDSEGYVLDVRLPGFLARFPSVDDFAERQPSRAVIERENLGACGNLDAATVYDPELWRQNRFAFVLERPLLIRVLSVLLFSAALGFIWFVVSTSDRRQLGLNLLAYFSALWGIRSALGAAAPKTPSLIDYSVAFLYSVMIIAILARTLWGFNKSAT